MATFRDRAEQRLRSLEVSRPYAVLLAETACLAVRVEAHLLRRLRLECVPDADVGAEADLWFSRLVESRGASAIVLDHDVVGLLRENLARDRTLLERVAALTAEAHRDSPPALQLEEQVNAVALRHGEAAATRVDTLLEPAVRALKASNQRGREIARWWLGAAHRFAPSVWRSENALALLVGSSALLQRRVEIAVLPAPPQGFDRIAWALPRDLFIGHVDVDVELETDRLHFREPRDSWSRLSVPATTPPLVEVRWLVGTEQRRAMHEVSVTQAIDLGGRASAVTLRTLRGAVYEIALEDAMTNKRCFVSMPFGVKIDYRTGRKLDMDVVYQQLVKPAVERAGLQCMRADEIATGLIERSIFEQLLSADLVIADLSTASARVAYELGMRHGLRPSATLIIAEEQHQVDFLTLAVLRYRFDGEQIDDGERERFRSSLTAAVENAATSGSPDSPAYAYLPGLVAPVRDADVSVLQRAIQTLVREVMTPRPDIIAIASSATLDDLRAVFRQQEHSHIPVYDGNLDDIRGVADATDLLKRGDLDGSAPVSSVMRPAHFVPETKRVMDVLTDFQRQRIRQALVVDEFGGTAGLVTLGDLLDVFVGDFTEDVREAVIDDGGGGFSFSGKAGIDELRNRLGVDLAAEGVETVGGYLLSQLGRVPSPGEVFEIGPLSFEVLDASRRGVGRVQVRPRHPPAMRLTM